MLVFGWARLIFFGGIGLTVIYFSLSWYSKSVRREKLEKQFDAGGIEGDRQAFIEQGIKEYEDSLRRKLIYGVYVVPVVLIAIVIYMMNF